MIQRKNDKNSEIPLTKFILNLDSQLLAEVNKNRFSNLRFSQKMQTYFVFSVQQLN